MSLGKDDKTGVISSYRLHESDTGSPEVQVALLSERIKQLQEHFKEHKKDHQNGGSATQLARLSQEKRHQSLPGSNRTSGPPEVISGFSNK